MHLILVTGGARSGKSDYARRRALESGGAEVTCIATARADDSEMARRIARHRADRPEGWKTVEASLDAHRAVRGAVTDVVVLDCFTLLAANALEAASPALEDKAVQIVVDLADELTRAASARAGMLFVVTNEVGSGIVPATRPGRWFRDALGAANHELAVAADEVVLLICGLPLTVKPESRARAT